MRARNIYETFGKNLKKIRLEKGLSQKQAAKLIGVAASTYSQYESGARTPTLEAITRIADCLGITTSALISNNINSEYENIEKEYMNAGEIIAKMVVNSLTQEMKCNTTENEKRLIETFNCLNIHGQTEALKRIEELTEIKKYRKEE